MVHIQHIQHAANPSDNLHLLSLKSVPVTSAIGLQPEHPLPECQDVLIAAHPRERRTLTLTAGLAVLFCVDAGEMGGGQGGHANLSPGELPPHKAVSTWGQ